MRTSRFSNEQIIQALRQAEAETPVMDICRKLNITATTFYRWNSALILRARRQSTDEPVDLETLVRAES